MQFSQLLNQASVSLDPRGYTLAKEHRNCAATSRLLVAIRAFIDKVNDDEARHERDKAKLADANSKLATRLAELERELSDAKLSSVRRGLEALPDVTQSQRDRALSFNGG